MKLFFLLTAMSVSLQVFAQEQLYVGKILSKNRDCSLTVVKIDVEEDGIKNFLVKTSFTGKNSRKLSNLVRTRKGISRYVVSDIIADNSFSEDSKDRISILVQRNNAKSLIYENGKKKHICRLLE